MYMLFVLILTLKKNIMFPSFPPGVAARCLELRLHNKETSGSSPGVRSNWENCVELSRI
jgi:hypothetical protein